MLTMVSLLLVGGSLGDQFGRRRLFVIGLIAFGATSILCALAPSEEFLVGARALQGIAGALLVPGSLAIVASTFSGEARGQAVGTWTAWTGIATVFGPAGGGALVGLISWRAIFWVNIPLIAVTVVLALRVIEESSDPDAFRGIDVPGVLLSAAGLAGPVFALIEQPTHGWGDPLVWVPLIAGVACFAAFVAWEARASRPMLDLSLFRIRNFAVANLTTLTVYAGLAAGLLFVGLYLQQVVGYTPFEAGLATMPISLCLFFLSPRWGRLASGTGPRLPMTLGPIVAGARDAPLRAPRRRTPSYVTDVLPAVLRLRPRDVGDGGAADRDRARLGLRAPRRDRLGDQQRRLAGRGAAGDRGARRGDLGALRRAARLGDSASPAAHGAAPRHERGRRSQGTAARRPRRRASCARSRRTRDRRRLRRRLDLGLPPRRAARRAPDDPRRDRRRDRDREPAAAAGRGQETPTATRN